MCSEKTWLYAGKSVASVKRHERSPAPNLFWCCGEKYLKLLNKKEDIMEKLMKLEWNSRSLITSEVGLVRDENSQVGASLFIRGETRRFDKNELKRMSAEDLMRELKIIVK
jgi:hypothetical protein